MSTSTTASRRAVGATQVPLPQRVATELRTAILRGRLKAGDRLVELKIAEELGVSRNPVREAIRFLAAEGLVEILARRGAVVAGLSEQEAAELVEVRALLEGHNARLAARRQDRKVLQRIAAVLERGGQAVAQNRFDALPALNARFHQELSNAGCNEMLSEMLHRLRDRTAVFFAMTEPGRQTRQWQEHAAVLRAILDGDEERAATLAAEHVKQAMV